MVNAFNPQVRAQADRDDIEVLRDKTKEEYLTRLISKTEQMLATHADETDSQLRDWFRALWVSCPPTSVQREMMLPTRSRMQFPIHQSCG